MASKTLFESVMWGTARQVQDILSNRDLPQDDNWTDYALLMTALRRKRKEVARILLTKGCRVCKEPRTDSADTPLHCAVRMSEAEIVKMLLERGAAINCEDQNGETPLYMAMKKGAYDIVDMILNTADVLSNNKANASGLSHFHIACIRNNTSVVEKFVKSGVDINASVNFDTSEWPGYTALHFAVENNCIDVIKLLLNCNADPTVKNAEDKSALHLAMQKQNDVAANLILSQLSDNNSNPVDENSISHFHIACMKYHLSAVENLLQHGIQINQAVNSTSSFWPGYTALHFAVKGLSLNYDNQLSIIHLLLRYKADVNIKDALGQTALHLACLQSDEKIAKLIQEVLKSTESEMETEELNSYQILTQVINKIDQTKIIELLLNHNGDINVRNSVNETPLFYLFKSDRTKIIKKAKCEESVLNHIVKQFNTKRKDVVKYLLEHGADVNVQNDSGLSLLHLVASINKIQDDDQKEELAKLLLTRGAEVDSNTKYGSTPLHLAAKEGHAELIRLLVNHGANVNARETSDQSTPLHLATAYQQTRAIEALVACGADVNATKSNGMNVLHLMALVNPDGSAEPEFIEAYERLVGLFVEGGCDIDAQDINGRTALHLAAWEHNNAATWALITHFADVNVEDCGDQTATSFPVNSTQRSADVYFMLHDYISMMQLAGLPLDTSVLFNTRYVKLYEYDATLRQEDDFLKQCQEELERMKAIRVKGVGCLYDIINATTEKMTVHAGNESLRDFISTEEFKYNFKLYGNLLKKKLRQGLVRKLLLQEAKESLEILIGMGLPDACAEKIFQYLSDKSLKDVVKARTVITNEGPKSYGAWTPYDPNECASLEKAIAYCKKLFNKQAEMEIA